ncbi:hypothetical protein L596_000121 [Steinernema carpocapsae]|uniref:Uncharacterized protein n=1 Tax=Steinernema carpocapsae TaxID=34508 RepID=A0A4U8UH98_STECR|nr:hypothetical protein L596_000121 [Steinernema carpocapsae]
MAYVGEAGAVLEECILNVKTVASCNGQKTMIDKYSEILKKGRFHAVLTYLWNGIFDGVFFIFLYVSFGAGFFYGGWSYLYGTMSNPGNMFVVAIAILIGSYWFGSMSHFVTILRARVAAAVIYKTIDRVPPINSLDQSGKVLEDPVGSLKLKDVCFSYPTKNNVQVLNGLSWSAEPGQTVALVGKSGCGKTTSISILMRLYECSSGQVTIDGHDIRELNICNLRNIVGIVEQEPNLFNGTIAENIRFGNPDITDEEMVNVCKIANAHDFIQALGDKYDTLIGAGGVLLSGGQKQRIAIARAISRNPKILLLDEATSALDAESETVVQQALKKATKGRTTVIIAHRLSTLRDVDKIYVIDGGKVIESGSHAELMALEDGNFAKFFKAQQFKNIQSDLKDESLVKHDITEISELQRSIIRKSNRSAFSSFRSSIRIPRIIESLTKLDKTEEIREKQKTYGVLSLYKNCQGFHIQLILAFVMTILRGFEMPLYCLLLGDAFNTLKATDDPNYKINITRFLIESVAIGVFTCLTIFGAATLSGWTAENVVDLFRIRAFKNVIHQDAAFFDQPKMSPRQPDDSYIINNVSAIVVSIVVSLAIDCVVGLAGVAALAILILLTFYLGHKMTQHNSVDSDDLSKASIEIVEQVRTIQLLTRESTFHKVFSEHIEAQMSGHNKVAVFDGLMYAFAQSFLYFTDAICFGVGIYMIYHGSSSAIGVYITATLIESSCWSVVFACGCLGDFIQAGVAAGNLLKLIKAPISICNTKEGKKPDLNGNVSLQNIQIAYPSRPNVKVINGLCLEANPGETIALVGPSGGGKSTIISILQRFYEYQSGAVSIDSNCVRSILLDHLRSQTAVVGQEPVLFSGTIYDNVRLGVPEATDEDVRNACKMASAAGFIEKMPMGYNSEVGERGTQLSGGQKQRIAIARALVRNPKILLLDEATSTLDAENEKAVQNALNVAASGRTCITIAHRLSSIQHADKIFFIKSGQVLEAGTHSELMQMDGLYAELIRKQDLKNQ